MNTGSVIMRIKTIVSGVAVALAVSVGSASAADQFATLDRVTAQPMNAAELAGVQGRFIDLRGVAAPSDVANFLLGTGGPTDGAPAGGPLDGLNVAPPGNPLP